MVGPVGLADGPLQRLHAAHRGSNDGVDFVDAQTVKQLRLAAHHVAHRDRRKCSPCLTRRIGRRDAQPVAQGVDRDHGAVLGIERLARANQKVEPVVRAGDGAQAQHHRFVTLQRPVHHIADKRVLDDAAALGGQLAQGHDQMGAVDPASL
jgi:hypothetical protein